MANMILPLGQHRLDSSPDFDTIRSLLRSLWTNSFWICERIASIAAADGEPGEIRQELAYLRGEPDESLQYLARLIELLFAGHAVDIGKRIGRGNSPPYFREGVSMAPHTIPLLGQHGLDPASDVDPVRFFLTAVKTHLVRLEERRVAFERLWVNDPEGAEAELVELRRLSEQARQHLARLIELLLAGHAIDLTKSGPNRDLLRLFKACTEAEWFSCSKVDSLCQMLRHLDFGVALRFSDRKWRLFNVACVRRVSHFFKDERTRGWVDVVERRAEGLLTEEEVKHFWREPDDPPNTDAGSVEDCAPDQKAARCAFQSLTAIPFGSVDASCASRSAGWARNAAGDAESEERAQVTLLRDVFGNPYRPALPPAPALLAWNDGVVKKLAQAIYDERAFYRLPILADALEDAGCMESDLLAHCRQPNEHARGCWVIDLLLGKD